MRAISGSALNVFWNNLVSTIIPVSVLVLWELAGRFQWLPPSIFASFSDTAFAWVDLLTTGKLLHHAAVSLERLALGATLGASFGLVVGILIGGYKIWERLLRPTLNFLVPVPPIAWIPFFIVLFGLDGSRISLIAFGTFLFVAVATASGIRSLDKGLMEVAQLYEYSGARLLLFVLLPAASGEIMGGIRAGVGISWILLVASELIASSSGIGWLMWNSRSFSRPADMLAACATIAILGLILDASLASVQRRLTIWRPVFQGN